MVEPEIEEFQEEYDQYDDSEIFNIRDPGLNRSSSYQIYKTQDLLKLREAKISDAMKDLYLTRDEAIIVLIGFRWDLNKFKDVWYDNVDQYRIKFQIDLDPYLKEIIEKKIKKDICRICDIPLNKNFFSLKCGHSFCEDCWIGHCESKIEDINSILLTSCPQNSCSLLVPESVFLRYLSSENKEILNVAILKNFTDANNDIRWCPTPNCGICIQSQSHSSKDIECECGASFCFSCTKEAHRPCQCEMIDVWDKKNNSEAENVKWLMVNTKKCPNCKKFIEKNQGCNHMTCRKEAGGCSYEFCWICMGEWSSHAKDYYNCNKFDAEKAKKIEDEGKNAKFELEKYVFYFNRWMNHQKAMQLAKNMRATIKNTILEFNSIKLISYEDLKFLESAVEVIIKCRRTLKNTYVFGYYIIDKAIQKPLFEHNQWLLEKNADRLHELMEGESLSKLIKIDNYQEFNKEWSSFKADVVNLSTATTKYQENILSDIETKMLEIVNFKLFI